MCTIAAYEPGVMPVEKHLRYAMKVSPHGFGYAIRTSGKDGAPTMLMCKSLHGKMMLDQFMALRDQFPGDWAVFWARRSTGSLVSVDNCQPLMVGKWNPETLLFHNGHLFDTLDPAMSDSRAFARDLGTALDDGTWDLDDPDCFAELEHLIRPTGSKVLIITSHPRWQQPVYFFNRPQWHFTEGGPAYSNSDYLGPGVGWDEMVLDDAPADPSHGRAGDTWRYRIAQPGQCGNCGDFGHDELVCEAPRSKTPLAWRNESQNNRILAALAKQHYG